MKKNNEALFKSLEELRLAFSHLNDVIESDAEYEANSYDAYPFDLPFDEMVRTVTEWTNVFKNNLNK